MIFNTIAAGGTVPEYIWVEYEITKVAGLPWRLITDYAPGELGGIPGHYYSKNPPYDFFADDTSYAEIVFDSATGKITGKGSIGDMRFTPDSSPQNPASFSDWLYVEGLWYYFTSAYHPSGTSRYFTAHYTKRVHSEPTYTITCGAIKTIHLTEQTGDQFRKIPIIK